MSLKELSNASSLTLTAPGRQWMQLSQNILFLADASPIAFNG
ncbi:hypothetical protein KUC_1711 [Vreelandella boliviensis LC1]|uniref:Uncharacterized protein n=1 Tax=Vreelandella boliviensis LC1 TaxID=1072583 RepID=A0A7U9C792_9GAMM|nr:hypothetical protein KUC_1711 [Halomonas boliviensis LC1]